MPSLVLKKSSFIDHYRKWAVALRYHDLGGTDYCTFAYVSDEIAGEIKKAGAAYFLYHNDEPEQKDLFKRFIPDMNRQDLEIECHKLRNLLAEKERK